MIPVGTRMKKSSRPIATRWKIPPGDSSEPVGWGRLQAGQGVHACLSSLLPNPPGVPLRTSTRAGAGAEPAVRVWGHRDRLQCARTWPGLLLFAALVLAVSGCGGGESSASGGYDSPPPTTGSSAPEEGAGARRFGR